MLRVTLTSRTSGYRVIDVQILYRERVRLAAFDSGTGLAAFVCGTGLYVVLASPPRIEGSLPLRGSIFATRLARQYRKPAMVKSSTSTSLCEDSLPIFGLYVDVVPKIGAWPWLVHMRRGWRRTIFGSQRRLNFQFVYMQETRDSPNMASLASRCLLPSL